MVLTKPIPGQEAANAEMLVREGAAVLAPRTADVVAEVTRLLKDPAACEALRASARRLYLPATETIVAAITEAVDS
jgi:UDP-N-acetylglucosamine:LPS N-acetylglucosamine transferase